MLVHSAAGGIQRLDISAKYLFIIELPFVNQLAIMYSSNVK
jgi:hypothetical protein